MAEDEPQKRSATELAEQVGRDAGTLALRELQLAAARNDEAIRKAVRDLAVTALVGVAFAAAFILANWALVAGLEGPLPGWRAPAVVAAGWLAVAVAGFAFLHATGRTAPLRRLLFPAPAGGPTLEEQRDTAEAELRADLAELSGALASETGVIVAAAIVPVASGVVDAGEDLIDTADELTDRLADSGVPGGRLVNQAFDIALVPGRLVIRATTAALKVNR